MSNPMTTQGDIIVGGASGTPTRLAKGTAGQVLAMNSGATGLEWTNAGGGTFTGGFTLSFNSSMSSDTMKLYYADGTSESFSNYPSATRNNVVACEINFVMPQLNAGVVFGYDSTTLKICTPSNYEIGYFTTGLLFLLSNATIIGLGMGD